MAVSNAFPAKLGIIVDSLKSKSSTKLSESVIGELKSIMKSLSNLRARLFVLDKYGYIKFAQAPETVLADVWNEIAKRNDYKVEFVTSNFSGLFGAVVV